MVQNYILFETISIPFLSPQVSSLKDSFFKQKIICKKEEAIRKSQENWHNTLKVMTYSHLPGCWGSELGEGELSGAE